MTRRRLCEEAPLPGAIRRGSAAVMSLAASLLLGCSGAGHGTMTAQGPDGGGGAPTAGAGGGAGAGGDDAGAESRTGDAGAQDGGPITVNVTVDHCPTVLAAASPSMATPGKAVTVDATAADADGDPLAYLWSATSGTFAAPAAASTTFTCARSGDVTLTVTVSDHRCDGQAAVPFTCLAGP